MVPAINPHRLSQSTVMWTRSQARIARLRTAPTHTYTAKDAFPSLSQEGLHARAEDCCPCQVGRLAAVGHDTVQIPNTQRLHSEPASTSLALLGARLPCSGHMMTTQGGEDCTGGSWKYLALPCGSQVPLKRFEAILADHALHEGLQLVGRPRLAPRGPAWQRMLYSERNVLGVWLRIRI